MACICQGCHKDYTIDLNIQDELWYKITPKTDDAGLLCPLCICNRLINLGMSAINVIVNTKELEDK